MNNKNSLLSLLLLAAALCLELTACFHLQVLAQSFEVTTSNTVFTPPKDGAPDNTSGAGSRNSERCADDEVAQDVPGFKILTPSYIQTSAERPTFSVYIPKTVAKEIFFSLKDANENYYYQTTIPITNSSGEFSFQLPKDAPAMEANKEYTWFVGLICKQVLDPNDPTVQGVIRRSPEKRNALR